MLKLVGIYGGGLALAWGAKKYLDYKEKPVKIDWKGNYKK